MIEFKHKLPSLYNGNIKNGTYNNAELMIPCVLSSISPDFGMFLRILHNNINEGKKTLFIQNKAIPVLHNWIRDDVHIMKAAKHFDYRIKDFLDFIISHQSEEGFYYELVKQLDDEHHKFVDPSCYIIFPVDNVALTRLELEADVEYLVVEGVLHYYRSSGDLEYVKKVLPSLEKAINYMITSPKRFSKEYGLIIRPYTIDTWDFTSDLKSSFDRRIHENENMCAMHGDNSGIYSAMITLAWFNNKLGLKNEQYWNEKAKELKNNIFKYLWNGKFFVHQFPINCKPLDDKENIRLSLSNPYDINRKLTSLEQSTSIIEEYQKRKKTTDAFCEYFSIDPAYKKFHQYAIGKYVNGAISPFTAGELALASFDNGKEEYGYSIIKQFEKMVLKDKTISFLYDRDYNGTQNDSGPSAWGAASILNAVDEGLFGIKDTDCLYQDIVLSPKLVITEFEEIRYFTGYEKSDCLVELKYIKTNEGFRYDLISNSVKSVNAEILVTPGKEISKVEVNGKEINYSLKTKNSSKYVSFACKNNIKTTIICYYK